MSVNDPGRSAGLDLGGLAKRCLELLDVCA